MPQILSPALISAIAEYKRLLFLEDAQEDKVKALMSAEGVWFDKDRYANHVLTREEYLQLEGKLSEAIGLLPYSGLSCQIGTMRGQLELEARRQGVSSLELEMPTGLLSSSLCAEMAEYAQCLSARMTQYKIAKKQMEPYMDNLDALTEAFKLLPPSYLRFNIARELQLLKKKEE